MLTPFRPILRRAWVRLSPLADRLRRSRLYPYLPRVRKVRLAIVSLFIMGTIASLILPALQVRAASLTWTNNSDFSNNQISRCQSTTMNGVVVTGTGYGDPTCAATGQDSSLQLDSAPNYLTGITSVMTSAAGSTIALKNDGTVWMWGLNDYGQLGNGTTSLAANGLPVQVKDAAGTGYLTGVKQVITDANKLSLAVKTDGTVWAWGYNNVGQVGDGTTTNRSLPVQVKDTAGTGYLMDVNTVTVSGNGSVFAIKNDGTAWGWGYNNYGQLGYNSTVNRSLPIQVKDAAGTGYLTGVSSLVTNGGSTIALRTDGTVWSWGYNNYGQLGYNSTTNRSLPIQVKDTPGTGFLTGVSSITNSGPVTMAIKSDGTLWAWGYNNYGQLGDNSTTNRWLPVQVKDNPGTGFISGVSTVITTSNGSTLALKNDGTVWGWGYNNNSQLGDGGTLNHWTPYQVRDSAGTGYLTSITSISMASNGSTLALKNDGTVWGWGYNNYGQLGDGGTSVRAFPVQVRNPDNTALLSDIKAVGTIASGTTIAAVNDGTVMVWGYNANKQAGVIAGEAPGENKPRLLPDRVVRSYTAKPLDNIAEVAMGGGDNGARALALREDGTVWNISQYPERIRDANGIDYFGDVKSIAVAGYFSLFLKRDGTVWAQGGNTYGQLGDGSTNTSNSPLRVKSPDGKGSLNGVVAIAAGYHHSLALMSDGTVWAWGRNSEGQLGDGTTTGRLLPVQVKDPSGTGVLTDVHKISASGANEGGHSVALKGDGTVWSWGPNASGQLGDGTTSPRTLPVQTKDATGSGYMSGVTSVAAGRLHSIALKEDGTVWAWGYNDFGQLGDNSSTQRNLPVQVKDSTGSGYITGVTAVSAGGGRHSFSLALRDDKSVWSWGNNGFGQLGDGTGTNRSLPVQVKDAAGSGFISGVVAISAGGTYGAASLALTGDKTVWAWGSNRWGQLGDNTTINRTLPVQPLASVSYNGGPGYATNGTTSGYVVDAGINKLFKYSNITWNTDALPADTSVVIDARYSVAGGTWSAWTTNPAQATAGSTTGTADLSSLPYARYLELRVTLTSSGTSTPTLNDFTLGMMVDSTAPTANAGSLALQRTSGGPAIADGSWTNAATPYASWSPATDNAGGSGIAGYCLYLGQDGAADVASTKGFLGASPMDSAGLCPFATAATTLDLSAPGMLGTPLTASATPYHLLVKAFDNAHNLYAGAAADLSFRYDGTSPNNVSFISLPSQFVPTKDVTITWPTSGSQAASDDTSGIAGLQYRIGATGTWYGAAHNGQQDTSDVLPLGDGNYRTNSTYDYPLLADGNNMIYFRAIDNAGNVSSTLTSAVIKINSSAPSSPQSVTATPTTNTSNSFAFSWQPPATFVGTPDSLTYCYTVNTLPTATTCSDTTPGQTSLSAGAYATQPGDNTFYVVARDQAGNINYATAASVTFTANTPAPGLPINIEIADVSVKATSNWKLALSWEAPTNAGAGVANYRILRSTSATGGFTQIATTAGLSYVDTGLAATTYYYKVKACDSANNCGAVSEMVSLLPTGRFTTPAEIIGAPSVVSSTKRATIDWTTARGSDSRIQYGTASGKYLAGEITVSSQTKTHEVDLSGLEAGTTYYYRAKWTDEDGNVGTSAELSFTTLPAPKVKDVKVTKANLSGAIIQFTSTDAAKVSVYYGKTEAFGGVKTVNTSRAESSYTLQLDGLDDGATYYYRPDTIDADGNRYQGNVYSFTTPPRPVISGLKFQPVAGEPTSTQLISWTTNVPTDSTITYGKAGTNGTDVTAGKLVTAHELTVRDLEDDSTYFLIAHSRDADGNLAASDKQTFKTALDTRPPKVSDLSVETAVKGNGTEARGQVIVSWKTDELATSQVAYGQGSDSLTSKTAEDTRLTRDHIVIISDLAVSKVYYVQPISKDKADNQSTGTKHSAIIGRPSESVLNIIMNSLNKVFGW